MATLFSSIGWSEKAQLPKVGTAEIVLSEWAQHERKTRNSKEPHEHETKESRIANAGYQDRSMNQKRDGYDNHQSGRIQKRFE